MNLKKVLMVYFIISLPLCLGINYLFENYIIYQSEISGAYKVHRIIHEYHKDEIPIIGSSRAQDSYVPSLLGGEYFNYGINGALFDVNYFFIKQELAKNKNTPIIVNFDYHWWDESIGDINNYIPSMENKEVKGILNGQHQPYHRIPFLKYFGNFEPYFKDFLNQKFQATKITDHGGSFELNVLTVQLFNKLVEQRKNTVFHYTTNKKKSDKLFRLIEENPTRKFIFVIAPYHKSFFVSFQNPHEANAFLNTLDAFSNVDVLNYSQIAFPDSLYVDTTHLNYKGAIEFTNILKKDLARINHKAVSKQ